MTGTAGYVIGGGRLRVGQRIERAFREVGEEALLGDIAVQIFLIMAWKVCADGRSHQAE